jgi:hypothetical protein
VKLETIKLDSVRIDGGTQSRVAINADAVEDYAEAMTAGATLPPVVVFFDGAAHWLADGFHRLHAHRRIGAVSIAADVRHGTQRDAQLFAYGANQAHGLRRTNDDKRKAVAGMLELVAEWSDAKIARHVGVSDKTVAAHRKSIFGNSEDAPTVRTVERAGKTYQQDASKIGKARPVAAPATVPAPSIKAAEPANDPEPWDDEGAPSIEELMATEKAAADDLAAMTQIVEADDKLAEARSIIKRQQAVIDQLQWRVNGLVNENAELIRMVKSLRRRAEKDAA